MKKTLSLLASTLLIAAASFAQTGDTTVHKTVTHTKTVTHHTTTTTQPAAAATHHTTVHKTMKTHPAATEEVTTDSTSVHRKVKKPA